MGNSPKQNNDFDNIDITGMLTGQEKEAMNAEDAQALAIITARMAGNALSLMRNALATHSSRVIFNMPVEMSDHARCSMAIALNTAAETFAKIEERNTDAAHTFDIAVQRFGLMQEENA